MRTVLTVSDLLAELSAHNPDDRVHIACCVDHGNVHPVSDIGLSESGLVVVDAHDRVYENRYSDED